MTDTAALAFLGLTMTCARCHDHKFEPISQKDYFRLQAFFTPAAFRRDLPISTPAEVEARAAKEREYLEATEVDPREDRCGGRTAPQEALRGQAREALAGGAGRAPDAAGEARRRAAGTRGRDRGEGSRHRCRDHQGARGGGAGEAGTVEAGAQGVRREEAPDAAGGDGPHRPARPAAQDVPARTRRARQSRRGGRAGVPGHRLAGRQAGRCARSRRCPSSTGRRLRAGAVDRVEGQPAHRSRDRQPALAAPLRHGASSPPPATSACAANGPRIRNCSTGWRRTGRPPPRGGSIPRWGRLGRGWTSSASTS